MAPKHLIRRVLQICHDYNYDHLPASLSALSVMAPLFDVLKPEDVFVLSKGHGSPAYYACLERAGFHPDLNIQFPHRDPENGIPTTSGSLGHGLPTALGIAFAKHLLDQPGMVHVLMGDAECMEGTTWESLNLAAHLGLKNLLVHIDGNQSASLGGLPYDVCPNVLKLWSDLVQYHITDKGAGVSFLAGMKDHKRILTEDEYARAMKEMEQ